MTQTGRPTSAGFSAYLGEEMSPMVTTNEEKGAFGIADGVIAVACVALAGVALLTLNGNMLHQRSGPSLTPALIAGTNYATDLQALAQYSGGSTGNVSSALAKNSISLTEPLATVPTPFPGARAKGFTMPSMSERSSAVTVTGSTAGLTAPTYNAATRITTGYIKVTNNAGAASYVPIQISQGTATATDCAATAAAYNAAHPTQQLSAAETTTFCAGTH